MYNAGVTPPIISISISSIWNMELIISLFVVFAVDVERSLGIFLKVFNTFIPPYKKRTVTKIETQMYIAPSTTCQIKKG